MSDYFQDSDYAPGNEPKLEPVSLSLKPAPSPPPYVHRYIITEGPGARTGGGADGDKGPKRQRHQPSQGDVLLLRTTAPNYPEVATEAGQRALCSASQSEAGDSDDENMEDADSPTTPATGNGACASTPRTENLMAKAQEAMRVHSIVQGTNPSGHGSNARILTNNRGLLAPHVIDTKMRMDQNGSSPSHISGARVPPGTPREPDGEEVRDVLAIGGLMQLTRSPTSTPRLLDDAFRMSPIIAQHLITPSIPSPAQTLPAMDRAGSVSQPGSATSPLAECQLPPIRDIVENAAIESGHHRARGSSFGSVPTLSPSMKAKQAFSGPGSPGSPSHRYPRLNHTSPGTSNDERSPLAMFDGISPGSSNSTATSRYAGRRRATSDATPPQYQNMLLSASSGNRNAQSSSTDGIDSKSHQTSTNPRRSLDGRAPPSLQPHSASSSAASTEQPPGQAPGLYRCTYVGCNAPGFQTQYLLNSHANVHSDTRPHYCPVKGCNRGVGGRGFKRKNEMIRHGLVHDSPGYVCPYCPDREHRYPRPDNLQRHVRMHHEDMGRDDPRLQDVLSQRPPGAGNRGRRRARGS